MSDELDRVAMVSDLTAVRTELIERMDSLEKRLGDTLEKRLSETADTLEKRLSGTIEKRLSETEETMRRHFNIVAERVESSVRLVAEVNAHHASILSSHETRLQKIEKRR